VGRPASVAQTAKESDIHTTRILSLSQDLPVVIVIVDHPDRIDAFLPELDELITEGLVVREPVEVVKYVGRDNDDT
jgi:PII-like signaling protein